LANIEQPDTTMTSNKIDKAIFFTTDLLACNAKRNPPVFFEFENGCVGSVRVVIAIRVELGVLIAAPP
jgi:hypothetical protein